jgi:hypothetical protein
MTIGRFGLLAALPLRRERVASSQERKLEQVCARAAGASQHSPSTSSSDLNNG